LIEVFKMRKILNGVCISVVVFAALFITNVFLYAYSSDYKEMLDKRVSTSYCNYEVEEKSSIIVEIIPAQKAAVQNTQVKKETSVEKETTNEEKAAIAQRAVESVLGTNKEKIEVVENTEENAVTDVVSDEKYIVDRFYYEDCGNDTGYWVIEYSDGTFEVEN